MIHLKYGAGRELYGGPGPPEDEKEDPILAGVAQWVGCWPENQRVALSIPSQGTCLGCGPGPE